MKYLYLLSAIVFLLAGCNSRNENRTNAEATAQDSRNARNTDHEGTYQGVYMGDLPTASGSGMMVTIDLKDGRYTKTIQYKDDTTREVYRTEGEYTWNRENNKITLQGEEAPNTYLVGSNQLYHLDMDGNRITGDLADQYILRKK